MSRPMRSEFPGEVVHITSRGNERKKISLDDRARENFKISIGSIQGYLRDLSEIARIGTSREESIYRSYVDVGCTMKEIADCLGVHDVSVSRAFKKYENEK